MLSAVLVVVAVAAAAVCSWKWLRVSQREHYEGGRCSRLALIWCTARPVNWAVAFLSLSCGVSAIVFGGWLGVVLAGVASAAALIWPYRLATFPRQRSLVFTARARRLTAAHLALAGVVGILVGLLEPLALSLWVLAVPVMVDITAAAMSRVEANIGNSFVKQAQERLHEVAPQVIAITGSYGKTSTKVALASLLEGSRRTLVSPASFNNLQGLSKTVNDRLSPGVQVFVAEMGTYGLGEIRRLCAVFQPEIVAITTIGEAHLERMKDRETIVRAKSEIVEGAKVVVLNVEVPELSALADRLAASQRVIRCATTRIPRADVVVDIESHRLFIEQDHYDGPVELPEDLHPSNMAVAIGLAIAAGVSTDDVVARIANVRVPEHRAEVNTTPDGVVVIDDTYNSNPVGAAKALDMAVMHAGAAGQVYVVTPGMVELGSQQAERNREFAASIPANNGHLVVVGWTNRKSLMRGAIHSGVSVSTASSREEAGRKVGRVASSGDVILFENDLPDHYP